MRVRLILKSQIALYSVHIIIPNVHPFSQKIKQIKDTDVFTGLQYINVVRNSLQISDIFLEQSCCTPDFGTECELLLLIFHTLKSTRVLDFVLSPPLLRCKSALSLFHAIEGGIPMVSKKRMHF